MPVPPTAFVNSGIRPTPQFLLQIIHVVEPHRGGQLFVIDVLLPVLLVLVLVRVLVAAFALVLVSPGTEARGERLGLFLGHAIVHVRKGGKRRG